MNVSKSEFLSAVLDDEAGDFERRRMLDELQQDEDLQKTWGRYAVAGEVMRSGKTTPLIKRDFLAGIQAAIEEDEIEIAAPTPSTVNQSVSKPTTKAQPKTWRSIAQYAVAASFGAVAMLVWSLNSPTTTASNQESLAQTSAAPVVVAAAPAANDATAKTMTVSGEQYLVMASNKPARPISRLDPKTQAILKSYIKDHIRYASTTTVVPTVRAVSYNQ